MFCPFFFPFPLHQRRLQTPTLTREWVVVTLCLFITCLIACIVCGSFSLAAAQTFIGLEVGEYLKNPSSHSVPRLTRRSVCDQNLGVTWQGRAWWMWKCESGSCLFGVSLVQCFLFFFFSWPKPQNSVSGTNWAYGQTICLFIHYRQKKIWHIQMFGRKRWTMDESLGPRGFESKSGLCVRVDLSGSTLHILLKKYSMP